MAIYKNVEPLEVVRWTATGHHEYDEGFADGVNFVLEKLDTLSEALEEDRAGKPLIYMQDGKPEGKAVEMADCIIRILDWMGKENIDAEDVIATKHAYNETRPYKHGKNY